MQLGPREYWINPEVGVQIPSNTTLSLADNTILHAIPLDVGNYGIVQIEGVSGAQIRGGHIVGDRYEHPSDYGQWGHGVRILNAHNCTVRDVQISECWGDGIYIGNDSSNITVEDVVAENNRRQGMSITYAQGVVTRRSVFKLTQGHPPGAGVDVEPNTGQSVSGLLFEDCVFDGNDSWGLILSDHSGPISDVIVRRCAGRGNRLGAFFGGNEVTGLIEEDNDWQ